MRRQAMRRGDANLIAIVVIILIIIGFALYGVAAAASNFELKPRQTSIERHWQDYEQRRQQATETEH